MKDRKGGSHEREPAGWIPAHRRPRARRWGGRIRLALTATVSEAAWRSKPSWYLVATEDRMIPPPAQRSMAARAGSTVVEVAGSHAIYVSQPAAVATLIKKAASAGSSAAR